MQEQRQLGPSSGLPGAYNIIEEMGYMCKSLRQSSYILVNPLQEVVLYDRKESLFGSQET